MWIFGYGSLMWDDWHASRGCLRSVIAELPKYRRSFNKASVKNWGTKDIPCPTLNLVPDELSSCQGIAFEFQDNARDEIMAYLQRREGKNFAFREFTIILEGGERVVGLVPIYQGTNIIDHCKSRYIVQLVRDARGVEGECINYLKGIVEKLETLGVKDDIVTSIWDEVQRADEDA